MKKNAVKNFIFSFLLSLLAVVTVNKIVFRAPENIKTDKKVSSIETKSISLFSKNNQIKENIAKPVIFADIEKLSAKTNNAANTETLPKTASVKEPISQEFAEAAPPIIVYNPEIENNSTNIKPIQKEYNTDLALATELVLEKEVLPVKEEKSISKSQIAFADISDTIIDEEKLKFAETVYEPENEYTTTPKTIQTAPNNIVALTDIEEDIPLMQNEEVLHENINILTSAETSQIAMLEPNTLVSSIETLEEYEEASVAEVNLKQDNLTLATNETIVTEEIAPVATNETVATEETPTTWTQMSETKHLKRNEPEDNPWVVAKGNRFAKNKIAQFDALSEEKEKSETQPLDNENTLTEPTTSENQEVAEEVNIAQTAEENHIVVHQKTSDVEIKENIEFETPDTVEANITLTDIQSNPIVAENVEQPAKEEIISEQPTDNLLKSFDEQPLEKISLLEPKPLLIPSSEGTKLARQMMDNLVIPIPQDIMNDADAMPTLSATPNKNKNANKELSKEDKDSGLFKSITSWFSGDKKTKEEPELKQEDTKATKKEKKKKISFSLFDSKDTSDSKKTKKANTDNAPIQIMPAELKLAFQPNRAEISGHTLKWIHAFADNARDNPEIYIEIRIDGTSSFTLQQKRLNLLSTIFANRDVDFRKVNIVFTSREPNSFIIRNIRFNNSEDVIVDQDENNTYYQQW